MTNRRVVDPNEVLAVIRTYGPISFPQICRKTVGYSGSRAVMVAVHQLEKSRTVQCQAKKHTRYTARVYSVVSLP
jgi:hypothetical protein